MYVNFVFIRMKLLITIVIILLGNLDLLLADFWSDLLLPDEHIPYYFYNNKDIREKCIADDNCPYKVNFKAVKLKNW